MALGEIYTGGVNFDLLRQRLLARQMAGATLPPPAYPAMRVGNDLPDGGGIASQTPLPAGRRRPAPD
jgi:hypothetical protein